VPGTRGGGARKAAALLMMLGADVAAGVLRHCNDKQIEALTQELLGIGDVTSISLEEQKSILDECVWLARVQGGVAGSGLDYVWQLLTQVLGEVRANELIKRIRTGDSGIPFDFLQGTDPDQLAESLQEEHAQTVAVILSYLPPKQAAQILSRLRSDLQRDVAERVVTLGQMVPEVIKEVERGLAEKLSPMLANVYGRGVRGVDSLIAIMKNVDRGTEKTILEYLSTHNPALAEQVRQKMFVFEDLVLLDDRSVQRVLREIDPKDLPLALKGAGVEVRELIFRNLSTRAREMLNEELESMSPQRLSNIDKAQQRIVDVVRRLEEAEEIFIARGGEKERVI